MRSAASIHLARRTEADFLRWRPLRIVLGEILREHGVTGCLGVAVVDDLEISKVHRDFLDIEGPTDVLSFRLDGGPRGGPDDTFGEVVISAETAAREARARRLPSHAELALYAIHGVLHLVGHDDLEPRARQEMRREERRWLRRYDAVLRWGAAGRRVPGEGSSSRRGRGGASRRRTGQ